MKKSVLLFSFFLSVSCLFSQSTFNNSYDLIADDYGNNIAADANGFIYVVGSTSKLGAGSYDAMLMRLDASGNFVWQAQIGGTGFEAGRGLTSFAGGLGYVITGSTNGVSVSGKNDIQISLIDTTGAYLGSKVFGFDSLDDASNDIISLGDTALMIIGTTKANGDGNHTNMFVIRTDQDANPLWMRTYGALNSNTTGTKIFNVPGIGFFGVGTTDPGGSGGPEYYLVNFDDSGIIQNQLFYGIPFYDEGRVFLFDGAHLILGGVTGSTSGPNRSNMFVTALNPNGLTPVWAKTYGGDTVSALGNIKIDPTDGNLVVAGYKNVLGLGSQALVFKIDTANGNVIWSNQVGSTGDEYALGVAVLADGSTIVSGETNEISGGLLSNAFVLKVEPNGNLCGSSPVNLEARDLVDSLNINNSPDHRDSAVAFPYQDYMFSNFVYSSTIIDHCLITRIKTSANENTIRIFPNPTSGKLFIESSNVWNSKATMTVYNMLGSEVLRKTIEPQTKDFTIDLSGNPKGMYFISINDGTVIITEKVSIN